MFLVVTERREDEAAIDSRQPVGPFSLHGLAERELHDVGHSSIQGVAEFQGIVAFAVSDASESAALPFIESDDGELPKGIDLPSVGIVVAGEISRGTGVGKIEVEFASVRVEESGSDLGRVVFLGLEGGGEPGGGQGIAAPEIGEFAL